VADSPLRKTKRHTLVQKHSRWQPDNAVADWILEGTDCEMISQTAKCGALSPTVEKAEIRNLES